MKMKVFCDGLEGYVKCSLTRSKKLEAGQQLEPEKVFTFADPSQMMEHLTALVQTGAAKRVFTEELKDNLLAGKITVDEAQTLLAAAFTERLRDSLRKCASRKPLGGEGIGLFHAAQREDIFTASGKENPPCSRLKRRMSCWPRIDTTSLLGLRDRA